MYVSCHYNWASPICIHEHFVCYSILSYPLPHPYAHAHSQTQMHTYTHTHTPTCSIRYSPVNISIKTIKLFTGIRRYKKDILNMGGLTLNDLLWSKRMWAFSSQGSRTLLFCVCQLTPLFCHLFNLREWFYSLSLSTIYLYVVVVVVFFKQNYSIKTCFLLTKSNT